MLALDGRSRLRALRRFEEGGFAGSPAFALLVIGDVDGVLGLLEKRVLGLNGDACGLPRYRGKMPGRCCWKIWETMKTLKALHWPATDHMWSAKHAFAWLASVMAAGKSLRAVPELYYETMLRWYGRPVSRERNFVPSGMFADLYASALALPEFAGGEGIGSSA